MNAKLRTVLQNIDITRPEFPGNSKLALQINFRIYFTAYSKLFVPAVCSWQVVFK